MEWFAEWFREYAWLFAIGKAGVIVVGGFLTWLHRRGLMGKLASQDKEIRGLRKDNRLLMAALAEPDPDRRAAILGRVSAKPVAALWDVGRPIGDVRPTRTPPEDKS